MKPGGEIGLGNGRSDALLHLVAGDLDLMEHLHRVTSNTKLGTDDGPLTAASPINAGPIAATATTATNTAAVRILAGLPSGHIVRTGGKC